MQMLVEGLEPGAVVAERYRVEGHVGVGGSAAVLRATRLEDGETVALKVMHDGEDPSGVAHQRFAREASLITQLRHPNIVGLLDFGQVDDARQFLALELLDGVSLKQALGRGERFDDERCVALGTQLLDAVEAAHQRTIIHRDLKPANVFLERREGGEGGETVRVLDFGLAKALEGDEVDTETLTGTGYRLGTPRYMSPEMARGKKAAEPGDLYAVALVLAEMVAGKPVVPGKVQIQLLQAHASDKPLNLPPEVVRSKLRDVIRKGLSKSLRHRYASAAEMRAALQRCLDPDPEPALGPAPARTSAAQPRGVGWVIVGLVALALLAAGLGYALGG